VEGRTEKGGEEGENGQRGGERIRDRIEWDFRGDGGVEEELG